MPRPSSEVPLFSPLRVAGLFVFVAVFSGCAGGAQTSDPARIASRFVPYPSTIEYSPDSLGSVSVGPDSVQVFLETSYSSLLQKWTSDKRIDEPPSRAHRPFRSFLYEKKADVRLFARPQTGPSRRFAVLRSKELLYGALEHNAPDSLSPDLFRERLRQRDARHRDTLQIDVYTLYDGAPPPFVNSKKIDLQDEQGHTYAPVKRRLATGSATIRGTSYTYRRESYLFGRSTERGDLVQNTSSLLLKTYGADRKTRYFRWTWDQPRLSAHR